MRQPKTKIKIRWHQQSRYKTGGIELRDRYSGRYLVVPADQAIELADQIIYLAEELTTQQKEGNK